MKTRTQRNIEFGKRLKNLRVKESLSVTQVATAIGVATTTYREWENGRAVTGQPYIELATVFGISVNELLGHEKMETTKSLQIISQIEDRLKDLRLALNS